MMVGGNLRRRCRRKGHLQIVPLQNALGMAKHNFCDNTHLADPTQCDEVRDSFLVSCQIDDEVAVPLLWADAWCRVRSFRLGRIGKCNVPTAVKRFIPVALTAGVEQIPIHFHDAIGR